jgi:hypothetical protein
MTGFPPRYSRDFMISLSHSFDALTFAPVTRAAMEEGHE